MPLVVMCGYPCSGKSKRAKELKNHFEVSRGKTVHLAGDESLNLERNAVYSGIIVSNAYPGMLLTQVNF